MIHSARSIVTTVANIVFCCFVFLDLISGTDVRTRTYGQLVRNQWSYPPRLWVERLDQFINDCEILIFSVTKNSNDLLFTIHIHMCNKIWAIWAPFSLATPLVDFSTLSYIRSVDSLRNVSTRCDNTKYKDLKTIAFEEIYL